MSSGLVLSFLRRPADSSDWNQQELAEFYRVESALLQGGLSVTTDRGISDEGDPWFVFCRADNEEVIAHFARVGREYVIVSNLHSGVIRGTDFRLLIRRMIDSHPLMLPLKRNPGQKILLHPAALLTAMLASAYFLASEKDATNGSSLPEVNAKNGSITSQFGHKFAVLAAASLAAIWIENQADAVFKFLENTLLFQGTAPSDDSGAHVAQFSHEVASLDTAITQAIRDVELGAHRIDLSSSNALVTQHDEGNGLPTPVNPGNVALTNGIDENSVNLAAPSNVPANDRLAASHSNPVASDTDSAASATNLLSITAAKDITPAMLASGQLAPTSTTSQPAPSVNPIVTTTEAVVQLATFDTVNPSIQPIVLSNGAVPLNLALEQASAQVGLDTNLPQSSTAAPSNTTAAPSNTASSPTPPVASASISQIMQTVESFLQDTPKFEITISGSNVVIIDTKLSDASSPDFGVLTWDLHNGSTLSIVGIIPHHHAPAAA
jgi:hypothetical protein